MNRAFMQMSLALALGLSLWLLAFMPLRSLDQNPSVARAASYTVCPTGPPSCGYSSIQAAVDAAGSGDVIKVAAGTYTDVHQRPAPAGYNGPSLITQVVFIDKSLTLRGGYSPTFSEPPNPEANPTILDARRQGRVLVIAGEISPIIEGLQITGGNSAGLGGIFEPNDDGGGGVYVLDAAPTFRDNYIFDNMALLTGGGMFLVKDDATLENNRFTDNSAGAGGALALLTSTTMIQDNTFLNNRAEASGGGLFIYSSQATLADNLISANRVSDEPDSYSRGGGLYIVGESVVNFTHNTVTSNTASFKGGGIAVYSSTLTLAENHITANSVGYFGGGLYLLEGDSTLRNNTISNNRADDGGGLFLQDTTAQLNGNIITGNNAKYIGGLVLAFFQEGFYKKDVTLINNIIAANQSSNYASGLGIFDSYGIGSIRLLHTTLARNHGGDGSGIYLEGIATLTNTILVSQTVGITTSAESNVTLNGVLWYGNGSNTGGPGTITITHEYTGQPRFAAPDQSNYHLRFDSAALDKGVDTGVITDIDGEPRPYDDGFDLGADEGQPNLAVSKAATPAVAQAGTPLTYTIHVTNSDFITLTATITDVLPEHVTPTGLRVWSPITIPPSDVWTEQVTVTVDPEYEGPLTNVIRVSSQQGAIGDDVHIAPVGRSFYLPVIFRME